MEINNGDGKAKILAYYLPQFYPCDFNDKWYGKGFTEWINVGKAKPLFKGHYQPRIPADLGYYDMRVPEVAIKQVELAKEAGVFGFCYWHYWWAGKRLLDMPAERLLKTGKPDFPIAFAWANESWYKKLWDVNVKKNILIMEQTYPGEKDNIEHFNYCLPFFKDSRYLTFDGRPIFYIYQPLKMPNVENFIHQWNDLIKASGVADSFYFVGFAWKRGDENIVKEKGFDAVTFDLGTVIGKSSNIFNRIWFAIHRRLCRLGFNIPLIYKYSRVINRSWNEEYDSMEDILPIMIPNWDHTARSAGKEMVIKDSNPSNFSIAAQKILEGVRRKKNKIIMLKSWNEWAEGNYMEPDSKFGKGFINVLGKLVEKIKE